MKGKGKSSEEGRHAHAQSPNRLFRLCEGANLGPHATEMRDASATAAAKGDALSPWAGAARRTGGTWAWPCLSQIARFARVGAVAAVDRACALHRMEGVRVMVVVDSHSMPLGHILYK